MAAAIIKVLIGLFIWMVLPKLIYKKPKYKKYTTKIIVFISCKIIGIALITVTLIGFLQLLFNI
jgi:hypothetical protein